MTTYADLISGYAPAAPMARLVPVLQGVDQDPLDGNVRGGSITVNRQRARRRSATGLSFTSSTLRPLDLANLLNPQAGAELRIETGRIDPATGNPIAFGQGLFTVRTGEWHDQTGSGLIVYDLQLEERSWRITRAGFVEPHTVADGTPVAEAIETIAQTRIPGPLEVVTQIDPSLTTTRVRYDEDDDPWAAIGDLAETAGVAAWLDGAGRLVIGDDEVDTSVASWTIGVSGLDGVAGQPAATIKGRWPEDIVNSVTVIGDASWLLFGVRGTSSNDDPGSPTYVDGPVGRRHEVIRSSTVGSDKEATEAARRHRVELTSEIAATVTMARNDQVVEGDAIGVVSATLGLDHVMALDEFTVPLVGTETRQRLMLRGR